MSGYLSRLVMRSQSLQTASTLRPFVRSKSPIAEQDQRLGIDGFDAAGASLPDTDSWALEESEPASSDSLSNGGRESSMTIAKSSGDVADATVQRKIAGPTISSAPSPPPAAPASTTRIPKVDGTPGRAQARPSIPIPADPINQGDRPQSPPSISEQVDPPGRPRELAPDTPVDSVARQPQSQTAPLEPDMPLATSAPQPVASTEPIFADSAFLKPQSVGQPSVVQVVSEKSEQAAAPPPTMVPNRRRSDLEPSNRQPIEPVVPNNIYSHVPRPDRPVPRLEPLTPREGTMEFEATVPMSAPPSPAVVIGRINVEVVPQSPATAPAAHSGPLTAASVSVIGPLRTGVRPNLRFSLRQR